MKEGAQSKVNDDDDVEEDADGRWGRETMSVVPVRDEFTTQKPRGTQHLSERKLYLVMECHLLAL